MDYDEYYYQEYYDDSEEQGFDNDLFEQQVQICKQRNKSKLEKEKLVRIHPDSFVYYNSLVVLCGPQGSGKTWTASKECARISQLDPYCHMIIVVSKAENVGDPTIDTFTPLFRVPVVYISEDKAEAYVKNMLKWKDLYNQIKERHIEHLVIQEQIDQMYEVLRIDNMDRPWLHTLIMFNDIAKSKLFKQAENYFPQIIALGRHTQCTSFLNIQFWKGLSPEIKANITTAVIFGLFSRQQFCHIISQLPSHYDYQELYQAYRTLKKKDKMIFTNGEVRIERKV